MKRKIALVLAGGLLLMSLSACNLWAEDEAPTETTEFVITE